MTRRSSRSATATPRSASASTTRETIATSDCDIPGEVVVFAYGDEIPNDGIAVSGDLPADLQQQIADALMAYAETEEGAAVLDSIYQITAFTEPNIEALDIVRQAAEELGAGG